MKNSTKQNVTNVCIPMDDEDRIGFLVAYSGNTDGIYHRGAHRGELKTYYKVDGMQFNKFWASIESYIKTSVYNSHYGKPYEMEDSVSNVKEFIFLNITMHGSSDIYRRLPLMVNNALTNEFRVNSKSTASLFHGATPLVDYDSDDSGYAPINYLSNPDENFWEFDIPNTYYHTLQDLRDMSRNLSINMIYFLNQYSKSEDKIKKSVFIKKYVFYEYLLFMDTIINETVLYNIVKQLKENLKMEEMQIKAANATIGEQYFTASKKFKVEVVAINLHPTGGVSTVEVAEVNNPDKKLHVTGNMILLKIAAPVVEEAPAPVVEEAPAPAPVVEEAPAPVVEEAPAPKLAPKLDANGKKITKSSIIDAVLKDVTEFSSEIATSIANQIISEG